MIKHVVIIDDCDQTLELFQDFLENIELKVSTFISPEKAFETMKKDPPHLLIVDYVMPKINGVDFIKSLRDTLIYTGQVFMITAKAYEVEKELNNSIPNIEVIPKPIEFELMVKKISDYFRLGS